MLMLLTRSHISIGKEQMVPPDADIDADADADADDANDAAEEDYAVSDADVADVI